MSKSSHFEINQATHPIYQVIGPEAQDRIIFAKRKSGGIAEEFHPILDQTVEDVMQKLVALYDVAMEQPRAFQILRDRHISQGPEKAREFIIETYERKNDVDDLTRKYVESYDHIIITKEQDKEKYGVSFVSAISSITIKGSIFIKESVEKKLTPKKSVTWKEDLEEVREIPARKWTAKVLQETGGRGK